MKNTNVLLSVTDLEKHFPLRKKNPFSKQRQYLRANDGISLTIFKGETFGLVGESGCGKSTFGRTILQLQKPTRGQVTYYGRGAGMELTQLKGKEMRSLRKDLQIIFQDPYSSLDPRMTVGQLIEEGLATHGLYKRGTEKMREEVLSVMKKCGLQSYALHRYPHQFSGGQRQRICIARALALKPKFIVCDECVSALDASVQSQILNLLSELKEKEKLTYLFISHDLSVVRYISDKIGVMYLGELVETGSAKSVFENPRHPYTISLMSAVPSVKTRKSERIILQGHMPSPVAPPSGCKFHTRCFMACERCKSGKVPVLEVEKGHFVACHFAKLSTQEKRKLAKDRENG